MHNAELYGRVLRVNYAQRHQVRAGYQGFNTQPVWAEADDFATRLEEREREKRMQEEEKSFSLSKPVAEQPGPAQGLREDPMEAAEREARQEG